jgi:hypothetical protein
VGIVPCVVKIAVVDENGSTRRMQHGVFSKNACDKTVGCRGAAKAILHRLFVLEKSSKVDMQRRIDRARGVAGRRGGLARWRDGPVA